jgi:hypothetical protein
VIADLMMHLNEERPIRRLGMTRRQLLDGGAQPILTIAQVKWALAKTKDNITKSAELLGCNRSTVHRFIRDNPELQEFRYHVIGAVCDARKKWCLMLWTAAMCRPH